MKLENNWRQKSLENLEKDNWGDPNEAPTGLVKRCLELRRVPLDSFNIEDLRRMIGQQIGLNYLIPLAIEKLQNDLFSEGHLYRGDLLENVLKVETTFWNNNKDLWKQVNNLIIDRLNEIESEIDFSNNFYASIHYQK